MPIKAGKAVGSISCIAERRHPGREHLREENWMAEQERRATPHRSNKAYQVAQSQVRMGRLPGKVQHTTQACPAVLHWGRDAIPYTALQGQAGNQKSSVFWGTLLFVILPISARPLGARPKRRRPAKARCGGQSPPDSGIAAKSWAPFSKKGKKAAVRWARRQVVIFAASGRG